LSQEDWGNVSSWMNRHRSASAVRVPKLFVRASLSKLQEPEGLQDRDDLARLENRQMAHPQRTVIVCVPTNSAPNFGSPSSRSISRTSWRFLFNSSNVAAWLCAPGNPGTYPTYSRVSGHCSTTAVYVFIPDASHCKPNLRNYRVSLEFIIVGGHK
jgi:hypothetical protein